MTDIVQLQNDVYAALNSSYRLLNVNVKQFRKMVIESQIDSKLIYLSTRNGRTGAGVLVEMPLFGVDKPNVSGPILQLTLPILVVEQPTINMSATTGTLKSAEEIVQDVLDALHLLHIEGVGLLTAASDAVSPANEIPGVVAYRVNMQTMSSSVQTVRPQRPVIEVTDLVATLTCSTDGAEIRYTTDGSYPARVGNPGSFEYVAPFEVESGDVIRAAAYKDAMNVSSVKFLQVQ